PDVARPALVEQPLDFPQARLGTVGGAATDPDRAAGQRGHHERAGRTEEVVQFVARERSLDGPFGEQVRGGDAVAVELAAQAPGRGTPARPLPEGRRPRRGRPVPVATRRSPASRGPAPAPLPAPAPVSRAGAAGTPLSDRSDRRRPPPPSRSPSSSFCVDPFC